MWLLMAALFGTTILCKSMGALVLLGLGVMVLFSGKFLRTGAVLAIVLLVTPAYMIVRTQGLWDGQQLVDLAAEIDEERAFSLQGRLDDENLLIAKASEAEHAMWGWGGWGRWRVTDEWTGENLTSSDGMWVIVRGERGNFGLVVNTLVVMLPIVLFMLRVPARQWASPMFAAPAALAILLLMWSIDNLFNAMMNPIYVMAAGGLSGLYVNFPRLMSHYRLIQQQQYAMMMAQQQAMNERARRMAEPHAAQSLHARG
jgi:hypothetical protein